MQIFKDKNGYLTIDDGGALLYLNSTDMVSLTDLMDKLKQVEIFARFPKEVKFHYTIQISAMKVETKKGK